MSLFEDSRNPRSQTKILIDENKIEDNETVILGEIYLTLKWIIGHVTV